MWNVFRFALTIGAAALIAGCGGSPSPIGAPGAPPLGSAPAARANNSNYKVLYNFGGLPDGRGPRGVINVGGTLYGTTAAGGSNDYCDAYLGCGTVFRVTLGGIEKVLYSFGKSPDGSDPNAGLIDVGGRLYGTTQTGGLHLGAHCTATGSGSYGCGTVFSITRSGIEKVVYSFGKDGTDGFTPAASLIDVNGTLYGTTQFGGAHYDRCGGGCGTVFSITPDGTEKILHSFNGTDGADPVAPLIEVNGKLYGTTQYGGNGAYSVGTVFSITLSGKEKVLHSFGNGTDGGIPVAGLIDVHGTLYGTTEVGGSLLSGHFCNHTDSCGTVFSITPGGTEKVLHTFSGYPDGAGPVAPLIDVKGTLYGTTVYGGAYSCSSAGGCGTIFSITPSGTEKVVHTFGTDGRLPSTALIDVNGTLYGTAGGGTYSYGTVFAFRP